MGDYSPPGGTGGIVDTVVAGDGIMVDATDPRNPIVATDGVFGRVDNINAGSGIDVDDSDPRNPLVSTTAILVINSGPNIAVDATDPQNPIVSEGTPGGVGGQTFASGVGVQIDTGRRDVLLSYTQTNILLPASVLVEISQDGVTYVVMGQPTLPALAALSAPGSGMVTVPVPGLWRVKFTGTNCTFAQASYF